MLVRLLYRASRHLLPVRHERLDLLRRGRHLGARLMCKHNYGKGGCDQNCEDVWVAMQFSSRPCHGTLRDLCGSSLKIPEACVSRASQDGLAGVIITAWGLKGNQS